MKKNKIKLKKKVMGRIVAWVMIACTLLSLVASVVYAEEIPDSNSIVLTEQSNDSTLENEELMILEGVQENVEEKDEKESKIGKFFIELLKDNAFLLTCFVASSVIYLIIKERKRRETIESAYDADNNENGYTGL